MFAEPWVERFVLPNPFLLALISPLREFGVELTDFSFNKDAANVGENCLNVSIRRLNAVVRVGLDAVTFVAANPAWDLAPQLVAAFNGVSDRIRGIVGVSPRSQEATLAFHVISGFSDFGKATAKLVNRDAVGECVFSGVSLYRSDMVLVIDKSLRHTGAAFVRLQRTFGGDTPFEEVAARLYEDELAALRMLGISEVP